MAIYKPQDPIEDLEGNKIYPITSVDQITMDDGTTRLNNFIENCVKKSSLNSQLTYKLEDLKLTIIAK